MTQPDLSLVNDQLQTLATRINAITAGPDAAKTSLPVVEDLHDQAFGLVGMNRSLGPVFLQSLHLCLQRLINSDSQGVSDYLNDLATRIQDLPSICFMVESLMAANLLDHASQAMESAFAQTESDFRAQDLMYRVRYYRNKDNYGPDKQGLELSRLHCNTPFQKADFLVGGNIFQCCCVWLRQPAGNMFEDDAKDVWQGKAAETIRDSILDGSFVYCGRMACHHFNNNMLPEKDDPKNLVKATPAPTHLNLSYDLTCNLFCPSCRTDKIAARGEEAEKIQAITETSVMPLLKDAEYVEICGSGDPFASKAFRHVLHNINREENPKLNVTLMTNGQLFNAREWERFHNLQGMISHINVSVDATDPDTYAVLRRGGELDKLIPNLEFIGELLADKKIGGFRMCFVVQGSNFEQMPDFVRLSERVGANAVHFQMLHDWGTMDHDLLKHSLVQLANHPRHQDFVQILDDIACMDRKITVYSDFDEIRPIDKKTS